jgi:DNA-binding MarR family transcriptional regulator
MAIADDFPLTLVHALSNRVTRSYFTDVETKLGITLPEWRVLLTVFQEPGITAAEITSYWAMEKMAVNRAIQRLLRAGRLAREKSTEDARAYRLSLTPEGRKIYDEVLPVAAARYRHYMDALTAEERKAWIAAMKKLIARAGEPG